VGVPIQKGTEAILGPKARGEENGEEVTPSHPTLGSERALIVSSPCGVRADGPGQKQFIWNCLLETFLLAGPAGEMRY